MLPFLSDVGRCKVDGDSLSVRPTQPAIANGRGDPVFALFDCGVRQPDYRDLVGITTTGVDFDLHLKRLNADDRSRINLRFHNRKISYFLVVFATYVFLVR